MPNQPTQTQLDPQAVMLAKAIRQTESGGNFTAKGKSGEYGAYQYTEPTWKKDSAAAGLNVPLSQATPEQQNQVAYTKIKQWKDQGKNPGQIASMWNAGEGEPDAYTGTFSNGKESKGKNSYGVQFDVPKYAKSVATAYQTLKSGGDVGADPSNPSSIAAQQPAQHEGVLSSIGHGIQKVVSGIEAPFVGLAAAPVQALAKAIGQPDPFAGGLPGGILGKSADIPVSKLGLEQKAGDAAQVGSYFLPAGGLAGLTAAGALQGAGSAMSEGAGAQDVATSGLIGGGTALGLGVAGKGVSALADYLPQRIVQKFVPGLNSAEAEYATTRPMGSLASMKAASDTHLSKLGGELESALNSPAVSYVQPKNSELIQKVIDQFPDAGLQPEDVAAAVKNLVPLKANLANKFASDADMSLKELHSLNSALGNATFKRVFDEPSVKAGKDIGSAVYHAISDTLKEAAPESAPIFDELSKEIPLNAGLSKALRTMDKHKAIGLNDLLWITSGMGAGGPLGGLGGFALGRAASSPTVNLGTAGLLKGLASPAMGAAGNIIAPQIGKGAASLSR